MTSREVLIPLVALAIAGLMSLGVLAYIGPDSAIAAAVLGGLIAVYGPVIAVLLNRYYERKRDAERQRIEREAETLARRTPVVEKFISVWMGMVMGEKMGKPAINKAGQLEKQALREYLEVTESLMLWGSDSFIRNWGRLRIEFASLGGAAGDSSRNLMFRFEDVLMDLRRDAGYPQSDLHRGDLLRLFINDLDEFIEDPS